MHPENRSVDRPERPRAAGASRSPVEVQQPRSRAGPLVPQAGRRLPRRVLAQLQHLAGNRATADLVARPGATPETPLAAQRQAAPVATGRSSFQLDGEWVTTTADLASWYRTRLGRLRGETQRMSGEGVLVPLQVGTLVTSTGSEVQRLQALGSSDLDDAVLGRASDWLYRYEDAFTDLDRAYARAAVANLQRSVGGLEGAGRGLDQATAELRDQQRRAMLAGDENAMLATTDLLQSTLDTVLAFKDTALELRRTSVTMLAEELKWLGKGTPPSAKWLPTVADIATKVDKAYAAFAAARAVYTVAMGGVSEADEAEQGVSAMVTILGAGVTLLNASASLTVYVNVYVAPMAGLAIKVLAALKDQVRDHNLRLMQLGEWDIVAWWVEPTSSKAMFDYLRQVMRAPDSGAIPSPPGPVAEVFLMQRGVLAAGAGEAVPTKGIWFWRKIDDEKLKRWLFGHRREVWAMFFGSAPPPR